MTSRETGFELDSLEDERPQRRRRIRHRCIDRMCGAEDCANCHPENLGCRFYGDTDEEPEDNET